MTKESRLASIEGLTLAECLGYFDSIASDREKEIAGMVKCEYPEFERDNYQISEGDANGAYVLGWRWVDFAGTKFDKGESED